MAWIKRNISLVISALLALGLLGYGGYYLWQAIEKNNAVDQNIGSTKAEIERLLNMDPTPNPTNVARAKEEGARLSAFVANSKKHFPAPPAPPQPLDNQTFKSLLETTINNLHRQASAAGIKVGMGDARFAEVKGTELYYFTFDNQRLPVTFAPESLRPLTERLHEVQTMAEILFKARVNRLVSMRRSPVVGERPAGGGPTTDYIGGVRTNTEAGMVIWPYELTFESFSAELGAVIEMFQNAQEGFLLRSPLVEPAEKLVAPKKPPTNAPPAQVTTVINERLLRVTLRVDVIRPESFQPGGPGFGGPPGRGGPPRRGGNPPPGGQP